GDKEVPAEELEKGKWVIKGAEIALAVRSGEAKAAIKLDPSAAPPTIELTITEGEEQEKGLVMKGIYFRQDDKLTLAFGDKDKKDTAPSELKPGEGVAFLVLERVPKK